MFGGEVEDIEKTAEEMPWVSEGRIKSFQVKKKKRLQDKFYLFLIEVETETLKKLLDQNHKTYTI